MNPDPFSTPTTTADPTQTLVTGKEKMNLKCETYHRKPNSQGYPQEIRQLQSNTLLSSSPTKTQTLDRKRLLSSQERSSATYTSQNVQGQRSGRNSLRTKSHPWCYLSPFGQTPFLLWKTYRHLSSLTPSSLSLYWLKVNLNQISYAQILALPLCSYVWSWTSHLTFLCLSLTIRKIEIGLLGTVNEFMNMKH